MIKRLKAKRNDSVDYLRFKREMSSMLYIAMPRSKEVLCIGSRATDADYDLRYRICEDVCQIMTDVLTEGVASWCLCVNPVSGSEMPFLFRPRKQAVKGFAITSMVIRSRDIGISRRSVRSLVKRLKHSELPLQDMSLVRFIDDRAMIADHWGHALGWRMSASSVFTEPCILLNRCDRKILAIKLCEVIQDAMNEALSKSGLADYEIEIPTYDKEELETSRRQYVEGNLDEKTFCDLVKNGC